MFRHPHLNTYQKVYLCLPPWLGSEELGGFGTWGRGSASKWEGVEERFDCIICNVGVSCKMMSQI